MAYSKNTWQSGDVVTSAKLNNIENGIANTNGQVAYTIDDEVAIILSASYNDIVAMLDNGVVPFIVTPDPDTGANILMNVVSYINAGSNYGVKFFDASNYTDMLFVATSATAQLEFSLK